MSGARFLVEKTTWRRMLVRVCAIFVACRKPVRGDTYELNHRCLVDKDALNFSRLHKERETGGVSPFQGWV